MREEIIHEIKHFKWANVFDGICELMAVNRSPKKILLRLWRDELRRKNESV